jgi:two-component system chemotaxis sensor kinase CheA
MKRTFRPAGFRRPETAAALLLGFAAAGMMPGIAAASPPVASPADTPPSAKDDRLLEGFPPFPAVRQPPARNRVPARPAERRPASEPSADPFAPASPPDELRMKGGGVWRGRVTFDEKAGVYHIEFPGGQRARFDKDEVAEFRPAPKPPPPPQPPPATGVEPPPAPKAAPKDPPAEPAPPTAEVKPPAARNPEPLIVEPAAASGGELSPKMLGRLVGGGLALFGLGMVVGWSLAGRPASKS